MRKIISILTFSLFIDSTEGETVLKTFSPACCYLADSTTILQQKLQVTGISGEIESTACVNSYVFCQHYLYHHRVIKSKDTPKIHHILKVKMWNRSWYDDSKSSHPQKWQFSTRCRITTKEAFECSELLICGIILEPQDLARWSSIPM